MSFKDVFSFLFVSQSFLPSADDHQALIWDIQQMPRAIEDPILAYTAEGEINNVQWASTQPDWIAICYNNCLEILRVWTADIYCTCEGVFFNFRFVLVFFFLPYSSLLIPGRGCDWTVWMCLGKIKYPLNIHVLHFLPRYSVFPRLNIFELLFICS